MKALTITHLLHSRGIAIVTGALVAAALTLFYAGGNVVRLTGDRGFALLSANEWLPAGWLQFGVAMLANGIIVVLMALMNKLYNILRSMTSLYISLFAFMQLATPSLTCQLFTGPLLAIAAAAALMLLFNEYSSAHASRHVFLVFALFSFLAATQYSFALYLPVLLFCCWQMRVFNGRTLTGALLGIITPWWILFGLGVITPGELHVPDFQSVLELYDRDNAMVLLVTVVFTGILLLTVLLLNLFKTIAYNARNRAYNSCVTAVALYTLVAMMADYGNVASYIPLLNLCAAVQAAHYFSAHRAEKSYIAILAAMAVYIVLYLCQTVI